MKKLLIITIILVFSGCSTGGRSPQSFDSDCVGPGKLFWWVQNLGKNCRIWAAPPKEK